MTITSVTSPRPKTVSFPIGLFCAATFSVSLENLAASPTSSERDEIFPGIIRKDAKPREKDDDVNWNDTCT